MGDYSGATCYAFRTGQTSGVVLAELQQLGSWDIKGFSQSANVQKRDVTVAALYLTQVASRQTAHVG